MLKNIVERQTKIVVTFHLVFERDDVGNSGYIFDCDEQGNPIFDPEYEECQRANYERALAAGPEEFACSYNRFIRRHNRVTENAHGTCICGEEVELYDQYRGACQCPKCGRWYNLFGQSLIDPQYWEDDCDEY